MVGLPPPGSDKLVYADKNLNLAQTSKGPIEYWLGGEGPVVLALHGAPGGYDQALLMYGYFLEQGFRLLCPSRPGYLGTPLGSACSPDDQAQMIVELLALLSIESVCVIGFSAGGMAALRLSVNYPDLVTALLLDSSVTAEETTDARRVSSLMHRVLGAELSERLVEIALEKLPGQLLKVMIEIESTYNALGINNTLDKIMSDPGRLAYAKEFFKTAVPTKRRFAGYQNDAGQMAKFNEPGLQLIKCPTLIIHGTDDGDVPITHAHRAAKAIPEAKFIPVAGAFHLIELSQADPAAVRKIRVNFFQEKLALS